MKTFLLLLFLHFSLFALSFEENYKLLNHEIDTLSPQLSTEEKVALYYLVLATHDTVTSALSVDESKVNELQKMKSNTLRILSKIDDRKLTKQYLEMYTQAQNLIKQKAKKQISPYKLHVPQVIYKYKLIYKDKVRYKDKVIYQDKLKTQIKTIQQTDYIITAVTAFTTLVLGFFIGFLLFKNKDKLIQEVQPKTQTQQDSEKCKKLEEQLQENDFIQKNMQNEYEKSTKQLTHEISTLKNENTLLAKKLTVQEETLEETLQAYNDKLQALQEEKNRLDAIIITQEKVSKRS
uniref:hypothetical protein n=1 Tax=Sulfurimonas sp. TaxID=2022749 RepID=UPI002633CA01